MHITGEMPMEEKKRPNKINGFNVRILDDDTFTLRTENMNYEMRREYSFQNVKELIKGIEHILNKIEGKSSKTEDYLEKEKKY